MKICPQPHYTALKLKFTGLINMSDWNCMPLVLLESSSGLFIFMYSFINCHKDNVFNVIINSYQHYQLKYWTHPTYIKKMIKTHCRL